MTDLDDVIAAIATPIGRGGISVVRVSGRRAIAVAGGVFRGGALLRDVASHTVHLGQCVDQRGRVIDEVLVAVFRAPRSYTAEDIVEISCHGGAYVTRRVLEAVIASGARLAEPGEFTKRAFLNGRIDLSQAEAVGDMIQAQSELARRSSLLQLEGSLSQRINALLDRAVNVCGLVELELDFIEEDITLTTTTTLRQELNELILEMQKLVESFEYGRLWREGAKVVLIGRPNAGKSSLLNALLEENRAIVTEIPGTTRDVIEENVILGGMLFRLVDTAGIRETEDVIEREGVGRTRHQIQQADVCLYVVDISSGERDVEFIEEVRRLRTIGGYGEIIAATKVDLVDPAIISEVFAGVKQFPVSSVTRKGINELACGLLEYCVSGSPVDVPEESVVLTNERHRRALQSAVGSLKLAAQSLENGEGGELLSVDLKAAIDALGSIVGKVTTEDMLNSIFSRFCVGK